MKEFTQTEIVELFKAGIDCGQVVMLAFEEELGLPKDLLLKIGSPFGGGMFDAKTCGAVTGAYSVLGLMFGHDAENAFDKKGALVGKMKAFDAAFLQEQESKICKDILGYDLTKEDEMKVIEDQGLMFSVCPEAVESSIKALSKVLTEA